MTSRVGTLGFSTTKAGIRPWVSRLVRLGYVAKGLIYSLVGILAVRVALGMRGGRLTDPSGVLVDILRQPFGRIMLTATGIGIVAYAAYYLFEAIADLRRRGGGVRGWIDRSLTIIKAGAYGLIGVEALKIVFFDSRPSGGAEDNARMVMRFPLGEVFIVLVGVGIAIYGFTQLRLAWKGKAEDDIDVARVRREAAWLLPFGRVGTAARSVILMLMGSTLAFSGLQDRPSNADGYREILATIASVNPVLLATMGAGLVCFGVYQLCHARFARLAVE